MSSLSLRMTEEAHKKAQVIIYTLASQKMPYVPATDEMKAARERTQERVKQRDAYNAQVKAALGIEFRFTYCGFQASETVPGWHGDTWEVLGNGDFKIRFKQGVGHRACFWRAAWANEVTAFIVPPSAMDILYCIMSDDPHNASFECWCDDLGYDPDSRKAERIYLACVQQTMMFKRNFPHIELDDYEPLQAF